MTQQTERFEKAGTAGVDLTMKALGGMSKGAQVVASEMVDYTKGALQRSSTAIEKLISAKSLDNVFEVQSEYLKSSYQAALDSASKLGKLYTNIMQDTTKADTGNVAQNPANARH